MRTFWIFIGPIVNSIWYYVLFVIPFGFWYYFFWRKCNARKKQLQELLTLLENYKGQSFNEKGVFENFKAAMKPGFPKYVTCHLTTVDLICFQEQPAAV